MGEGGRLASPIIRAAETVTLDELDALIAATPDAGAALLESRLRLKL